MGTQAALQGQMRYLELPENNVQKLCLLRLQELLRLLEGRL